jgi:hypothetical protein
MQFIKKSGFLLLTTIFLSSFTYAVNVEVTLIDELDGDLNSYCLDIVGGKLNANPEGGLQAHTCYSYQGELGVDQAMDSELISQGVFKVVGFDVCMTQTAYVEGSTLALGECSGERIQRFSLNGDGSITPSGSPGLCLTAGEETRLGNNGQSRHQIKDLTLESCGAVDKTYQLWRTRETDD